MNKDKLAQKALEEALLLMKYDPSKTLTENKKETKSFIKEDSIDTPTEKSLQKILNSCSSYAEAEGTLDAAAIASAFNRAFVYRTGGIFGGTDDSLWRQQASIMKKGNMDDLCNVKRAFEDAGYGDFAAQIVEELDDEEIAELMETFSSMKSRTDKAAKLRVASTEQYNINWFKKTFPCIFDSDGNVDQQVRKNVNNYVYILIRGTSGTQYQVFSDGRVKKTDGTSTGKKVSCNGSKVSFINESVGKKNNLLEQIDDSELVKPSGGNQGGGNQGGGNQGRGNQGGGRYNADTAAIQQDLVKAGYYIGKGGKNKDGVDGIMGPATRKALEAKRDNISSIDYNASNGFPYPPGFDSAKAEKELANKEEKQLTKDLDKIQSDAKKAKEDSEKKAAEDAEAQKSAEQKSKKSVADTANKQYFGLDLTDEIGMQEVTDNVVELISKGYQSTMFARYYNMLNALGESGNEWAGKMASEVKGASFKGTLTNSFKKAVGDELNSFKNPTQPQMETGNYRQYKLTVFPKGGTSYRWRDLGTGGARYEKRNEQACYDALKEYYNMVTSEQLDLDMNLRKDKETIYFCFKDGAYTEEGIAKSFGTSPEGESLGGRSDRRNRKKEVDKMVAELQSGNTKAKYRMNFSQLPESSNIDTRIKNVLSEIYESKKKGLTESKIVNLRLDSIVEGIEIKNQKSFEKTLDSLVLEVSSLKESGISEEVLNEGLKDWFFGTLGGVLKSPTALLGEYIGKWLVGKLGLSPQSTLGGTIVKLFGNVNITDYPKFFTDCRFTVDKITDSVIEAVADNLLKQKTNVGDGILVDALRNSIADQILNDKESLVQKLQDRLYDFICPMMNKAGQKLDDVASQMQDKVVS